MFDSLWKVISVANNYPSSGTWKRNHF